MILFFGVDVASVFIKRLEVDFAVSGFVGSKFLHSADGFIDALALKVRAGDFEFEP